MKRNVTVGLFLVPIVCCSCWFVPGDRNVVVRGEIDVPNCDCHRLSLLQDDRVVVSVEVEAVFERGLPIDPNDQSLTIELRCCSEDQPFYREHFQLDRWRNYSEKPLDLRRVTGETALEP